MRRRDVPMRRVAGQVILPRLDAQSTLVLAGAAATVWVLLDQPTEPALLTPALAAAHPELDGDEVRRIVASTLEALEQERLLEHLGP